MAFLPLQTFKLLKMKTFPISKQILFTKFQIFNDKCSMYQHFLKKTPLGADTFIINLSDSVYKDAQTQFSDDLPLPLD